MIWLFQVLFWIGFVALLHSYVLYPIIVRWFALNRPQWDIQREVDSSPSQHVSVLMSVFNEIKIIESKIESLLELKYPSENIDFWIGSDNSDDGTNEVINRMTVTRSNVHFFPFQERRGKPEVINDLFHKATSFQPSGVNHLILLTDASVMMDPDLLLHLLRPFQDPDIGLVDANMQHTGIQKGDISNAENHYINREVQIKYWESLAWKTMIGPFGGCFAMRSNLFQPVPKNFLVDDFYLTMRVFEQGYKAVNALDALCFEPVSHQISEEFRRKVRISAGNFQNMVVFRKLWWPPVKPLNFAFFSHKILRWLGPIWLFFIFLGAIGTFFFGQTTFTFVFIFVIVGMIIIPLVDSFLEKWGINLSLLRNIRYFLMMNLALFFGLLKFLKGINTNVWQPTKRT